MYIYVGCTFLAVFRVAPSGGMDNLRAFVSQDYGLGDACGDRGVGGAAEGA